MTDTPPPVFSIRDPLPDGVTVLEASAGTGKTYAITALAVRYLADGLRPDQLLVMTFTNAATGELRERLRAALVMARDALDGTTTTHDDDVVACLLDGDAARIAARRDALHSAVARFDAVTVATTHSFCSQVLRGLGVAADVDTGAVVADDLELLVDQVVDDLYLRDYGPVGSNPPFDHATARRVGRKAALSDAFADLGAHPPHPTTPADCRTAFAFEVRAEVERRKRRTGVMTYDDLQGRLRDVLITPVRGPVVAARLRERFGVVLIDEFQDTDPVQYQIIDAAFIATGATVVMIGDPKQAIYGFRGADVEAYLAAARAATDRRSMNVSWRSDAGILRGCDALFRHARLGHPEIAYRPLEATPEPVQTRPAGLPDRAPIRVRVVHRDDLAASDLTKGKAPTILAPRARQVVADDLAADIVRLLESDAAVEPKHIAVLVRKRSHSTLIRAALRAAGVPAVISRVGSVFDTAVATEWLRLLEAVERPSSRPAVTAAALTVFCGWDAGAVAAADDRAWEDLHETIAGWGVVLRRHGVAALLSAISAGEDLPARILGRPDGERELTDLRHIGELLHAAAVELEAGGLASWLAEQIRTAAGASDSDERSRRLDSDADAVQVVTVHAAKGLEFPVVYCPYLWEEGWIPQQGHVDAFPIFHTPAGARRLVVGGVDAPGYADDWRRSRDEQRGEELRLLYVAMTRARHQLVIWWAATRDAGHSPLGRLLFAQEADGAIGPTGSGPPSDDAATADLVRFAQLAPGAIVVERAPTSGGGRLAPAPVGAVPLTLGVLDRDLDTVWRRTSYSGIVAAARDRVEPAGGDRHGGSDEAVGSDADLPDGPDPGFTDMELVLGPMPAGAAVGSLIHEVLEGTDFAATDLTTALRDALEWQLPRHRIDVGDPGAVAAGLATSLQTPLGGPFGAFTLAGLPRRDRIDEMAFELPLAGGERPTGALVLGRVADVLASFAPAGDPMGRYAGRLARSPVAEVTLRGFLNGFLDVVVRLPDGGYAVIDYKTNRLGPAGRVPSAWDYRPDAIVAAMHEADYPLQALLYLIALHRFLRWRVPGYDADRDIRGAGYLFVRGMAGAATPSWGGDRCGVWAWRPPAGLVSALSDALDEVRA